MMDKDTFSDFEREAMRERAEELRKTKNTEADVLDKISEMTDSEAQIAPILKFRTTFFLGRNPR